MTTPDHQPPPAQPPVPEPKDRVHRSNAAIAGGILLLAIVGWLGIDALVSGHDRTPWLALAGLILVVPLVVAFTLRPAVHVSPDRLRIRNPFRLVVLPWGQVKEFRSAYSNEVVDKSDRKFQLWALPVSLRARKKAMRQEARQTAAQSRGEGARLGKSGSLGGGMGGLGGLLPASTGPTRAENDQHMDDLRQLLEERGRAESAQGEATVRWAWEILGPALAGAVLLTVLLAIS